MVTLLLTWVSPEKAHCQAFQGAILSPNPTPSSFNYQVQHHRQYTTTITITFITTFIIIITIQVEGINGGSWSSNAKQTLCSQFNRMKMGHRMQDERAMAKDLTSLGQLVNGNGQIPKCRRRKAVGARFGPNTVASLIQRSSCCQLHIEYSHTGPTFWSPDRYPWGDQHARFAANRHCFPHVIEASLF